MNNKFHCDLEFVLLNLLYKTVYYSKTQINCLPEAKILIFQNIPPKEIMIFNNLYHNTLQRITKVLDTFLEMFFLAVNRVIQHLNPRRY